MFRLCDELAHSGSRQIYSCRRVISTIAARSTPNASKPVLIWPNAMLNNVVPAVAAPINSGIGTFRGFDFEGELADVTVQRLPLFPLKFHREGRGCRFFTSPAAPSSENGRPMSDSARMSTRSELPRATPR